MSWLFSRALVAEYSADTCSAGEPSAPLSVMPTPHKFWRNGKTMDASTLSQFGLTCRALTEDDGEAVLMSYLAAFPAKTLVPQGNEKALVEREAEYGKKWPELSVKYCRDSSSWKTHRSLLEEVLPWSSVTLPRWGMTVNGFVLRHPTLERPINGIGSGSSPDGLTFFHTPNCSGMDGGSNSRRALRQRQAAHGNPPERGPINPEFVEWLMGWPIGWTELKPLAMGKFHEWQQQHGEF